MQVSSSNWQSSGLQIRLLGVRIPPDLPFFIHQSAGIDIIMARLQKKKAPSEKKKPKKDTSEPVAEPKKTKKSQASFSATKVFSAQDSKAQKTDKASAAKDVPEEGIFRRAADYIREVQMELKKVTWPTRKQTAGTTLVVIILVFIVAAFLGIFDYGLSKLVEVVLT